MGPSGLAPLGLLASGLQRGRSGARPPPLVNLCPDLGGAYEVPDRAMAPAGARGEGFPPAQGDGLLGVGAAAVDPADAARFASLAGSRHMAIIPY